MRPLLWTVWESNPPHVDCKSISPKPWNMTARFNHQYVKEHFLFCFTNILRIFQINKYFKQKNPSFLEMGFHS